MTPIHSSRLFTYVGKMFIAEMSDLPRPIMGEIRTDDNTFKTALHIRSEKTQKLETFVLKTLIKDSEGDLEVVVLEAMNPELRKMGIEVHLLND